MQGGEKRKGKKTAERGIVKRVVLVVERNEKGE